MKKFLSLLVVVVLVILGFGLVQTAARGDAGGDPVPCDVPSITVTDSPAYDETIPGKPSQWWAWSPNKDQGPFDGPPAFPTDLRGTWQGPKTEGGPDGDGTFQNGNGHGSWFHREAGTPDTVIHHDAVTHEEANPNYPCVTETPTTPGTETTSEPPVSEFITPSWSVKVDCSKPLRDWIVADATKQYDVNVQQVNDSHLFLLTFNIVAGDFKFSPGDYEVSNDGKTAVANVFVPVVRCVVKPPVVKPPVTEQKCSVHKCVTITRDSSGKVTHRAVVKYGNVEEEGL